MRAAKPPIDAPTRTTGPTRSLRSISCDSSCAIRPLVRGPGDGSLYPSPARSYAHTRVNLAVSFWTCGQVNAPPPSPDSRTTAGAPAPMHQR